MQDLHTRTLGALCVAVVALLATYRIGHLRWLYSGVPFLTCSWILGAVNNTRVMRSASLWSLISTLNLLYVVSTTSRTLYILLCACCYLAMIVSLLFQFDFIASIVRTSLRYLLIQTHFIGDRVAFFDLPALKIDTNVDGLLVVRGVTFSFSSFTIVVHGIELLVKLNEDAELSVRTDELIISPLRSIRVTDVFFNLRDGLSLMFKQSRLSEPRDKEEGNAAESNSHNTQSTQQENQTKPQHGRSTQKQPPTEEPSAPKAISPYEFFKYIKAVHPLNQKSNDIYQKTLMGIQNSSPIEQCKPEGMTSTQAIGELDHKSETEHHDVDKLAAICAKLYHRPSLSYTPERCIEVTALQKLIPEYLERLIHRLPLLSRLLLNISAHLHSVVIDSITGSATGASIQRITDHAMHQSIFQAREGLSQETRQLQEEVTSWLNDASFVLCVNQLTGSAHIPIFPQGLISNRLEIGDAVAYRKLSQEINVKTVAQFKGGETTVELPVFLLPHHDHILPAPLSMGGRREQSEWSEVSITGQSYPALAGKGSRQGYADETNMKLSVKVHLPLVLDEEILDWTSKLARAAKMIEMDQEVASFGDGVHTIQDFSNAVRSKVKQRMSKASVNTLANDGWITELIGKVFKQIEATRGSIGYDGNIPLSLEPYRPDSIQASKILP